MDFDACELVNLLAQEARMQRLLQFLRNSQQADCLDNGDCLTDESMRLPGDASGTGSMWTILVVWFLVTVLALLVQNRSPSRAEGRKGGDSGSNVQSNLTPDERKIFDDMSIFTLTL